MPRDLHGGEGSGLAAWSRELRLSVGFLTRLPVAAPVEGADMTAAMRLFPAAGALVGLVCGVILLLAAWLGLPAFAAALISIGASLLLTGALHEDGLADMADGLGGRTREEALAIMRDSRTGSYGVMALILAVGLKAAALTALLGMSGGAWPPVLAVTIATGALSRATLPALLHALPPARNDGLSALAGTPSSSIAGQAALIGWILSTLALLPHSLLLGLLGLPLACAAGAGLVAILASRRLGGQTGDVAGAAQVAAEILGLLLAAAYLVP
ncbi:MAG: adenosylcobinamide-GDP ribazoletransferase [Parvibaculaceae bacterium]